MTIGEIRPRHWVLALTGALALQAGLIAMVAATSRSPAPPPSAKGVVLQLSRGEPQAVAATSPDAVAERAAPAPVAQQRPVEVMAAVADARPSSETTPQQPPNTATPSTSTPKAQAPKPLPAPKPSRLPKPLPPQQARSVATTASAPSSAPKSGFEAISEPTPDLLPKSAAAPAAVQPPAPTSPESARQPSPIETSGPTADRAPPPTAAASSSADPSNGADEAPPALPAPGSERLELRAIYESRLLEWIAEHKRYPRRARRQGLEGVVEGTFSLDPRGRVVRSRVDRSSGHPILDEAVIETIERASPMPAPPPGYAASGLDFRIPVSFKLN